MYSTSITHILQQLHVLHTLYICIILFTSVVKNAIWYNLVEANLFNVHEDVRSRPSTWFVVCLLPSLGPESKWDERGGNSKSARNTELMMKSNDCLFEGWNEQTYTTHIERWPAKSEVETHIVRVGAINNKPKGDKLLGGPGNCHHCLCPASHWLSPSRIWPAKEGNPIFRKVVAREVAAK